MGLVIKNLVGPTTPVSQFSELILPWDLMVPGVCIQATVQQLGFKDWNPTLTFSRQARLTSIASDFTFFASESWLIMSIIVGNNLCK